MGWKESLTLHVKGSYRAAEGLFELVEDDHLEWKPEAGENWMTMGQLINHIAAGSCGVAFRGFIGGEWDFEETTNTVQSVAEAKSKLADDKQLAFNYLADLTDEDLATRMVQAPWQKEPRVLGNSLNWMVMHLNVHRGQLYYYLKLMGKDIGSAELWGM
ncbi:DinB family protein [Candidatus Bipolaricaulota bacterium]